VHSVQKNSSKELLYKHGYDEAESSQFDMLAVTDRRNMTGKYDNLMKQYITIILPPLNIYCKNLHVISFPNY
jgi:hypothetical protein